METKSEMKVITKSSSDCPVVQVTVYKDRAQVSRCLEAELGQGIYEIHMTDFVEIEEDSIRVEGKGNATIVEVSFQSSSVHEDEVTSKGKEKALIEELQVLKQDMENLKIPSKKEVIEKERKLLDDFFNRAARSGIAPDTQEGTNVVLSRPFLQGVQDYMTEYRNLSHALISDLQELEDTEKEKRKEIEAVAGKLDDLRGGRVDSNKTRECLVVVESPKETKIQLTVSYVVRSASWIPSYDLRMSTDEGCLKVFYYGMIRQNSGEDWDDTKIFLSTAEPSFGGNIPGIPITHLSLYQPPLREYGLGARASMRFKKSRIPVADQQSLDDEMCLASSEFEPMRYHDLSYSPPPQLNAMAVSEVKVVDKTTSTSYEIGRQSTIPSDNNEHKVTVAILDFEPDLSYVTVPKASPNAFLTAKVVNTSAYMLLAGNSSIFLDNSFVAKALLKSAAPKEEFTCSLGVDPSVRVTYKPVIKMKSSHGMFQKSETNLYEQAIEVKNLHQKTVNVLVQDSLPKSTVDKIKVALLSPIIDAKKTQDIRLTKDNALEWDLTIESMGTKSVTLKYSVEHPFRKSVEHFNHIISQSFN